MQERGAVHRHIPAHAVHAWWSAQLVAQPVQHDPAALVRLRPLQSAALQGLLRQQVRRRLESLHEVPARSDRAHGLIGRPSSEARQRAGATRKARERQAGGPQRGALGWGIGANHVARAHTPRINQMCLKHRGCCIRRTIPRFRFRHSQERNWDICIICDFICVTKRGGRRVRALFRPRLSRCRIWSPNAPASARAPTCNHALFSSAIL